MRTRNASARSRSRGVSGGAGKRRASSSERRRELVVLALADRVADQRRGPRPARAGGARSGPCPTRRGCGGPRRSAGRRRRRPRSRPRAAPRRPPRRTRGPRACETKFCRTSASVRSRWARKRHATSNAFWRSISSPPPNGRAAASSPGRRRRLAGPGRREASSPGWARPARAAQAAPTRAAAFVGSLSIGVTRSWSTPRIS